ncbi:hypothetical protein K7I13_01930 [Brucepastera parasyntrophica]|uniref:hypothetical protein n=1 Tax=Brucepastera parasyntrophica TaxID=2880008 RepID=UPI00210C2D6E|nr:hypothetical protein [Brucepastera parasyntrophica]ULQ60110.1 hypothetical protein K7I13_01930 [Brucepastera parasyntrophica]
MINELYAVSEALTKSKINPKKWQREFKPLPRVSIKSPCLRICIGSDLRITEITIITDEDHSFFLRKWETSNGMSFPAFNCPPLYRADSDEQKGKLDSWLRGKEAVDVSLVRQWCTAETDNWTGTVLKKLDNCLHKLPVAFLEKTGNAADVQNENAVTELIDLLSRFEISGRNSGDKTKTVLKDVLETYLFTQLEKGGDAGMALRLLFGGSAGKDVSVIFDLADWQCFRYPVAHEKSMNWMNDILLSGQTWEAPAEMVDAFGIAYTPIDEPLPSVNLRGIPKVILRSMFKDHLCQYRYNLIEGASYPVARETRARMKGALEWLSDSSRQGKTWGNADGDEVVFAYPSKRPDAPVMLTALLGAGAGQDLKTANTGTFESCADDVISALTRLQGTRREEIDIQVFAIRKMDTARRKIVFNRNYSAERLIAAAEEWQKGCANIPRVRFRVWNKEEGKPGFTESKTPMPLRIASICNRIWKQDGSSSGEVKRIKYYQGVELFFEDSLLGMEAHILNTLLCNTSGLLIYLGSVQHNQELLKNNFNMEIVNSLMPLFGLLLYKQGYHKEVYMENIPYLFGQILKVSDELHAFYCKVVRDGNVPPQLAGASLLSAAFDMPDKVMAQLGKRMVPYISWAKQYTRNEKQFTPQNEKNRKLVGWLLNVYSQTAAKLPDFTSKRFDDLEKAQLFIGYLADLPRSEKPKAEGSVNNTEEEKITEEYHG